MPVSILVLAGVLVILAGALWYAARNAHAWLRTLGNGFSVIAFATAALVLSGGATATMYGGRPFGLEMLRPAYEVWIQRIERPTQPLVPATAPRP